MSVSTEAATVKIMVVAGLDGEWSTDDRVKIMTIEVKAYYSQYGANQELNHELIFKLAWSLLRREHGQQLHFYFTRIARPSV
jgi:hypothetical protein